MSDMRIDLRKVKQRQRRGIPSTVEAQLLMCPRGHIELLPESLFAAERAAGLNIVQRGCSYPQCGASTDLKAVNWGTWLALPVLVKRRRKRAR
jgi:hypothetical protein